MIRPEVSIHPWHNRMTGRGSSFDVVEIRQGSRWLWITLNDAQALVDQLQDALDAHAAGVPDEDLLAPAPEPESLIDAFDTPLRQQAGGAA